MKRIEFNENYFEKIDSEDKAYFLGFILADGCVSDDKKFRRKCLAIHISTKDIKILEVFKEKIEYQGDIWYQKSRDMCQIRVSSPKIIDDLHKYSIIPRKTNIVQFPNISKNLENHFMRGVFDGDGCISIREDNRENVNGIRGQVNLCSGSKEFIYKFVDKLVEYANVKRNKIRFLNENYYIIDWGGMTDVENIYNFLYKDATIFLERKKKTFDKVYNITKHRTKYRKK